MHLIIDLAAPLAFYTLVGGRRCGKHVVDSYDSNHHRYNTFHSLPDRLRSLCELPRSQPLCREEERRDATLAYTRWYSSPWQLPLQAPWLYRESGTVLDRTSLVAVRVNFLLTPVVQPTLLLLRLLVLIRGVVFLDHGLDVPGSHPPLRLLLEADLTKTLLKIGHMSGAVEHSERALARLQLLLENFDDDGIAIQDDGLVKSRAQLRVDVRVRQLLCELSLDLVLPGRLNLHHFLEKWTRSVEKGLEKADLVFLDVVAKGRDRLSVHLFLQLVHRADIGMNQVLARVVDGLQLEVEIENVASKTLDHAQQRR